MVLNILNLLGALALFLFGLYQLSSGLQKYIGDGLRKFIPLMKGNAASRILGGAGLTASIITSRESTATVISLVSAGILSLSQSVAIIMGANIGTTITAWLITLFGFTFNIFPYCFIILGAGFAMSMSKRAKVKLLGDIIMYFAIIFLGINFTVSSVSALEATQLFPEKLMCLVDKGNLSVIIFVLIGILLSAMLQSSSAVVVLSLIMCHSWLDLSMGCAMVIGANIGTTITTTLLSSKSNVRARQAAVVHFLFNISIAVIILIFYRPFIGLISLITTSPLYGICIFHTLFNLLGTLILVWFSDIIVNMLNIMFPSGEKTDEGLLKYIGNYPIGTAAISIAQAMKEVQHFGIISHEGFKYVPKALNETDPDKFEKYRMKLVEYEEISDKLEIKIANFLNGIKSTEISLEDGEEIRLLFRIIGELESLGDSCENISRILERERVHNMKFDDNAISRMNELINKVDKAYDVMNSNLREAMNGNLSDISNAYEAENDINKTRDKFRNLAIEQIEMREGNYYSTNYFFDIIAELEAMGDFMINISQAAVRNEE